VSSTDIAQSLLDIADQVEHAQLEAALLDLRDLAAKVGATPTYEQTRVELATWRRALAVPKIEEQRSVGAAE